MALNLNSNGRGSAIARNVDGGDGTQGQVHLLVKEGDSLCLLYKGKGLEFACGCRQKFKTSPTLERHLSVCKWNRPKLGKVEAYRCAQCMLALPTMTRISVHFRNCKVNEQSSSETAQAELSNASPLLGSMYPCRFCDRTFATAIGCGQHQKKAHGSLLHTIEPVDKVPRWSSTEQDLLIEAEATVRLDNQAEDERIDRSSFNEEIHKYISGKLPGFNRTVNSIQQRRSKIRTSDYFDSVKGRMSVISEERALLNAHLLKEQPDCADSVANDARTEHRCSDESPGDSTNSQSLSASMLDSLDNCKCDDVLLSAINTHLSSLVNNSHATEVLTYLRGILDDLDAYEATNFCKAMQRNRQSTQIRVVTQPKSTIDTSSKRSKDRSSKCAIERSILEKQGHKRCLQHLQNSSESTLCTKETVELFKSVFEHSSGDELDTDPFIPKRTTCDSHLLHSPVTVSEVKEQLARIQNNTAPGPDGIRRDALLKIDPSDLSCLFNIFLIRKNVPRALKLNKTTMLPKSAKPDIGDWRPITIASVVDRLFAKILEARLSRIVALDPSQRGFMKSLDGCGENITAYSGALRYSRANAKPLVVVSIDLAKAFDSVKYSTIERALVRLGVDASSTRLLMNLCHGHTTSIKHQDGFEDVALRKGVRQGWPLSPVLFLCVIDELLCSLKEADGFHVESPSLEKASLTGLAFADDVILYSSSTHGMQRHVDTAAAWCTSRGMKINPKKSTVLYLKRVPHKKKVLITPLDISIEGVQLPQVSDSFERVLGVHMHYTGKVNNKLDTFGRDLELVCNSALRPTQKISMIQHCLIPMIKFRLVYGLANQVACTQIDKVVRKAVRKVLHLPQYLSNNAIYATRKQGGIGLPCLKEAVPMAQARLVNRMLNSSNAATRLLVSTRALDKVIHRFSDKLNTRNISNAALDNVSRSVSEANFVTLLNSSQGAGWTLFKNSPRRFLDDPRSRKWSEHDSIDAIKMRSNVLFTRELIARTIAHGQSIELSCRGCKQAIETQSHILSKCPVTQSDRIGRHDSVCAYLVGRLRKFRNSGSESSLVDRVHREFEVRIESGEDKAVTNTARTLRPDIAVILDDRIVIIEVSVVYEAEKAEDGNTLKSIRRDKLTKYQPLKRVLAARFKRRCDVHTLIVGCRGGWIASNNKVFSGLGVPFSELDRNACVERAVRGSLITYRRFVGRTCEPILKHIVRQTT